MVYCEFNRKAWLVRDGKMCVMLMIQWTKSVISLLLITISVYKGFFTETLALLTCTPHWPWLFAWVAARARKWLLLSSLWVALVHAICCLCHPEPCVPFQSNAVPSNIVRTACLQCGTAAGAAAAVLCLGFAFWTLGDTARLPLSSCAVEHTKHVVSIKLKDLNSCFIPLMVLRC